MSKPRYLKIYLEDVSGDRHPEVVVEQFNPALGTTERETLEHAFSVSSSGQNGAYDTVDVDTDTDGDGDFDQSDKDRLISLAEVAALLLKD